MVAGPWYHGSWHTPKNDSIGHHSARRARDGARVPREHRGAVLPLLPARQGEQADVARDDVPDRIEYVADVRRVAAQGGEADEPLSARATARCRSTKPSAVERGVSRVRVRSGESGSVPPASDLADVSGRRLAPLGSCRPALRRRTSGRRSRTRARRSTTMSPSRARCRRRCSRRPRAPTPTSSSS